MFIIKRYPLTSSTIVLFGAYTVTVMAVKRIKRLYYAHWRSDQSAFILPELQHEIIDLLVRDGTDDETLSLTLVCKNWSQYLNNHPTWLKDRIKRLTIVKKEAQTEAETERIRVNEEALQQYGFMEIYSPKISYFIFKKRITAVNRNPNNKVTFPDEELKRNKNKDLYVPWMNQSIIRSPEVAWQFLWTAVRHPGWIFRWTKLYQHDYGLIQSFEDDPYNGVIIQRMASSLAVLLSILPTIDNMIYNISHILVDLWRAPNDNITYHTLWNAPPPLSKFAQIHSVLTLQLYQFFEQSFTTPVLKPLKDILLAILTLLSGGPQTMFKMACFSVISGWERALRYFVPNPSEKMLNVVSMITIAPIIYFYPIVTSFSFVTLTAQEIDALDRKRSKPSKLSLRYPFIPYFLTLIAPLLSHAFKQIKIIN